MKRVTFLLAIALLFAAASVTGGPRHALVVGCNEGGNGLEPLRFAESDAQKVTDVLRRAGEFTSGQIKTLLKPDSAALERQFEQLKSKFAKSAEKDQILFLFYFSGHSDGEYLLLGKSRFPLKRVKQFLDSCGAGVKIGVFDACYSGSVVAFKGGTAAEPFYFAKGDKVKGQVIIASTAARQRAQESQTLKGSIFTHHWVNGLKGSADYSGDRYVTLHEAYQYAYRKTVETSALTGGGPQHPSYNFSIQGEGEIWLTNLNGTRMEGIQFDRASEGSFLILSENYTDIFADFTKKSGQSLFIALSPGSYKVINAREGEVFTINVQVTEGSSQIITHAMLKSKPLTDVIRVKGVERVADTSDTLYKLPPSDFSLGCGTGVLTRMSGERWSDVLLSGAITYNVNSELQLYSDLILTPFNGSAGLEAGVSSFRNVQDFRMFAGIGPGFWYDSEAQDRFSLALGTRVGFAKKLSGPLELRAQIPFTFLFSGRGVLQTGIQMSVLFH